MCQPFTLRHISISLTSLPLQIYNTCLNYEFGIFYVIFIKLNVMLVHIHRNNYLCVVEDANLL